MSSSIVRFYSVALFLFFATVFVRGQEAEQKTESPEPDRGVVWLGFSIISLDELPKTIDLTKPQMIESAFLLQLRRQAVLLAAREELGAATRDAFLDETGSENTVRIPDVAEFPHADLKYVDHQQFLTGLEKLSRNEFVAELEKRGVKKNVPASDETKKESAELEDDLVKLEKSLLNWVLIPQFETVRRTHEMIRQNGESFRLLKLLVRGYSQLQILTNTAPRDTHRVFQARAVLYAQRAVTKFGETSETRTLRAAAWSLNDFHRLAREDFATIPAADLENADPWIKLARFYAEFDIKGIAATLDTADFQSERGLASLLEFQLLQISQNRPKRRRDAPTAFIP